MTRRRLPWYGVLALAMLLGFGPHAAPVAPSPGRWHADPVAAVHAESAWTLDYLATQPRTGDRIADSLYLALAEGEDAWAAAYLQRQHHALQHAAARLDPQHTAARAAITATIETVQYYQALVAAGQAQHDAFQRLLADQTGPQLRARALQALEDAHR